MTRALATRAERSCDAVCPQLPSVPGDRRGCPGAAGHPAHPVLTSLLHMHGNRYLNPSALLQQDISSSQAYPYMKGCSLLNGYQNKVLDKNKSCNLELVVLLHSAFDSLTEILEQVILCK